MEDLVNYSIVSVTKKPLKPNTHYMKDCQRKRCSHDRPCQLICSIQSQLFCLGEFAAAAGDQCSPHLTSSFPRVMIEAELGLGGACLDDVRGKHKVAKINLSLPVSHHQI